MGLRSSRTEHGGGGRVYDNGGVIKYLGSKRRLLPVLGDLFTRSRASTALDLFTGTTRVAQEFKRRGGTVTAVDCARYSEVFARCWIETSAADIDQVELATALQYLSALPGEPGYFTETFCEQSRFFQPKNGARVDAIRDAIERDFAGSPLYSILLTSLILAADRVDSTTGMHMAYLKQWAPRAHRDLELRVPALVEGSGTAVRGDALELAPTLGSFDFAYLDPPYNQHRYFTNYHIFETLVAWDRPEHYGVACKRIDSRDGATKSMFNSKKDMPTALAETVAAIDAEVLVLSYNDESWVEREQLVAMCDRFQTVRLLAFDSRRYIGSQIGVYNPNGALVGEVSHVRNKEWVVVAGPRTAVTRMTKPFTLERERVGAR